MSLKNRFGFLKETLQWTVLKTTSFFNEQKNIWIIKNTFFPLIYLRAMERFHGQFWKSLNPYSTYSNYMHSYAFKTKRLSPRDAVLLTRSVLWNVNIAVKERYRCY